MLIEGRGVSGRKLKIVSLFSGCGGFDIGAQRAGVEIIWANDIDPHAATAYKAIFPDVDFALDDIRNIKLFPKADILIGCYPCTGFSLAARRRWQQRKKRNLRSDSTNYLYQEFLRALKQVQPKYVFVENVRGMLTASNGWFFSQQIAGLTSIGYRIKYKRLSAADYGVPQSRQRVFIVGIKDRPGLLDYTFPQPTHGPKRVHSYTSLRDAIAGMEEWPVGKFLDYKFHGHYLTRNRKRRWNELSYTIVANERHIPLHPMGLPMTYVGKDQWKLQGNKNRRLSWQECAAIQDLPKKIAPSGSLEDKYRVVGNAVPPSIAQALIEPIVEFESAS